MSRALGRDPCVRSERSPRSIGKPKLCGSCSRSRQGVHLQVDARRLIWRMSFPSHRRVGPSVVGRVVIGADGPIWFSRPAIALRKQAGRMPEGRGGTQRSHDHNVLGEIGTSRTTFASGGKGHTLASEPGV